MRKKFLKVLACVLGAIVASGCVPSTSHATGLTRTQKILIGAGIGSGIIFGSAVTLLCVYAIGGRADDKSVDNGTVISKNNDGNTVVVDRSPVPHFSAEECVDLKLRYWRCSSIKSDVDRQALDAALNMYSLDKCGVGYRELINRFNKSHLNLLDFYKQFHSHEVFIKERTFIENICLVLVGDPFGTPFNDTCERQALNDVAKVVYRIQQTRPDELSEDLKRELETFKKGNRPLIM